MDNKNYFVLINPNAGKCSGKKDWQNISAILTNNGIAFNHQFSDFKGHAMEIAKETAIQGYKNLIIVGGDGTLNEAVNGILSIPEKQPNDITLSMIPVGTGNDWCRSFNIPRNYEEAVLLIKRNKTTTQDLAKVKYHDNDEVKSRYFANISGIGFDAHVAIKSNNDKQLNKSGFFVYFKNVITSLIEYKSVESVVSFNDTQVICRLFLLSVGKGKFNGGGMKQLPFAIHDDGFIDFALIEDLSKFAVISQLPKLYKGTHVNHPKISSHKTKKLTITTKEKIFLEVDGETFGHSPFEFEVVPSALNLICGF